MSENPGRPNVVARFFGGIGDLGRGFRMWGTSPRLMLTGAIPALIVGVVFLAAFIALIVFAGTIAEAVTPFADGWGDTARDLTRTLVAVAAVALGGVLLVLVYVAVVLALGDVFYERIARAVDVRLGGAPDAPDVGAIASTMRAVGDGLKLLVRGALTSLLVFVIGLIPVVGTIVGAVTGALIGGRLLATELTGYAFDARGFSLAQRRAVLARDRARTTGFGVGCYVLFFVPILSVVTMPAAVAGATILSRTILEQAGMTPQVESGPGSDPAPEVEPGQAPRATSE